MSVYGSLGKVGVTRSRYQPLESKHCLRRLTTPHEFGWRWSNQDHHKRQMSERIMATFGIKYISKQMLPFKQIPNLDNHQQNMAAT